MRAFRGLKVLAAQDEYDETNRLRQAIVDLGFHVVLTCVPLESLDYVYPRQDLSGVEFVTVFTGYAPDHSDNPRSPIKRLQDRRVVLGYRGRDIGARYGQLAFDKYEIGRRMREICDDRGVPHDIAMDARRSEKARRHLSRLRQQKPEYAVYLCGARREQVSGDDEASEMRIFEERVARLENDAQRVFVAQSSYSARAEGMLEEWRGTAPTEAALAKLRVLVAFHRERAVAYEDEYRRFDAVYMGIYEALQQVIADGTRKIEREAREAEQRRFEIEPKPKAPPIEALTARPRAAPALHRFLRWLRGLDSAA